MGISGEQISLGMQFVASFFWAIGAILAGPATAADFLQFFAAVAWCIANVASAWSMYVNKNNTIWKSKVVIGLPDYQTAEFFDQI